MRRILLIGAAGAFGSRLAVMLAKFDGIELVLAGRRQGPLENLQARLMAQDCPAKIAIAVFDRHRPNDLAGLAPWLVIDAAGPFQDSGYELALAAIDGGAHYIDLADGRTFVAGFPTSLDQKARARGVLAVTGASSTPALSHAALTPLVAGWTQIDETIVAISPGARSPRGLSVVKSILSYAGKPVRI
ncbi:MAG TPA: saccharopine dehydrogenase NADP-binding domain-containing protein, partial [Afipia sp.]